MTYTLHKGDIDESILKLFKSDHKYGDFFTYILNEVSLEKCVAVLGILSPSFVELDDSVILVTDAYNLDIAEIKKLRAKFKLKYEFERYVNNFSINQAFLVWEGEAEKAFKVDLSEDEYRLAMLFANQLKKFWLARLKEIFPDRTFEFEIGENLFDEWGICLTFWQV